MNIGNWTDEALVAGIKNDDEAAFEEVYNRYWQRLYARAPVGLINDTLLLGELAADPDLGYAGDALAASGMSRWASFKVLLRYLRKVLTSSAGSRQA